MATLTLLLLLSGLLLAASLDQEDECELTTGRSLTVIKSGGFPSRYKPNQDCRYHVVRGLRRACSVTFLFNVLDVAATTGCDVDFLQLQGERLCGSKPVGFARTVPYDADESGVTLRFHAGNGTRGGLGFMATVVQQECPPPPCRLQLANPRFVFSSPNYPLPYPDAASCTYTVSKSDPDVCRLQLEVVDFQLEHDLNCSSDFLLFGGQKHCGRIEKGAILEADFPNETMVLMFESDHTTTGDGFQFKATQLPCVLPLGVADQVKHGVGDDARHKVSDQTKNDITDDAENDVTQKP